jgi:hypothetical protein
VIVGEAKPDLRGKELTREVAYEKTPDGRETFKITVKASGHGGQGSSTPSGQHITEPVLDRAVRPGVQGGQTAPAHGRPKMLIPKRPEIGNWKLNVAKNQGSVPNPKVTFDMLFDKYSKKAITSDRPVKKRMRSPSYQERPVLSPRAAIRFRGESSQRQNSTPDWVPPLRPIYDDNGVMWVLYQQSFHPGWEGPRRSALERISRHTQDRWAPRQTGQGHLADPVRPPPTGGQITLPKRERFLLKVYKLKIREEEVQEMDIDPERTTGLDIIQIGTMNVPVEESGKIPVVPSNQVVTPTQKGSVANDHEASGSKSHPKCFLPRWCPPSLTHTQRRKLQRLRLREKREKELEKKRDKNFNSYRPMVLQGKEWRVKAATQPGAVTPPEGAVQPPGAVQPGDQAVGPGSPKAPPSFVYSIP